MIEEEEESAGVLPKRETLMVNRQKTMKRKKATTSEIKAAQLTKSVQRMLFLLGWESKFNVKKVSCYARFPTQLEGLANWAHNNYNNKKNKNNKNRLYIATVLWKVS